MLVLERKIEETLVIVVGPHTVTIKVLDVDNPRGRVLLGVDASRDVPVHRKEKLDQMRAQGNGP